jgi:monofunctional biosynthetic peptidoglycan transglycosylase
MRWLGEPARSGPVDTVPDVALRSGSDMGRWLRRLAVLVAVAGMAVVVWVVAGLPPRSEVQILEKQRPGKTALMRQREREARRDGRNPRTTQQWVPLTQVSSYLLHAVLASEDQRFFGHEGVDWTAVRESVEDNVERGRLWRGGSTLTQQLAKNLFFGTSRTPLRKVRELVVTRWIEEDLSKARILALYVNLIEWGEGIYGCEAAARHWYGKPASSLTMEEAAGLAAMIPNPRRINPRVNPRWFERARRRVLGLMERSGYIWRDVAGLGSGPPAGGAAREPDVGSEPRRDPAPAVGPGYPPGGGAGNPDETGG